LIAGIGDVQDGFVALVEKLEQDRCAPHVCLCSVGASGSGEVSVLCSLVVIALTFCSGSNYVSSAGLRR
jgi:hypothetical protein